MNQNDSRKPFFPRDKPKSWVVGLTSILAGLLVAAPLTISGFVFEIKVLEVAGRSLIWCFWTVAVVMWPVYTFRWIAGHYKGISSRDWSEQIW